MKEDFKALKIIHMAICAGMVLIYTVLIGLSVVEYKMLAFDQGNLLFLMLPIGAIFLSYFVFKYQLKQVNPNAPVEQKFTKYRKASISRWAILEAAVILIIFLKPNLMAFGMILILNLAFLAPSEEGMKNDFRSINT